MGPELKLAGADRKTGFGRHRHHLLQSARLTQPLLQGLAALAGGEKLLQGLAFHQGWRALLVGPSCSARASVCILELLAGYRQLLSAWMRNWQSDGVLLAWVWHGWYRRFGAVRVPHAGSRWLAIAICQTMVVPAWCSSIDPPESMAPSEATQRCC